MYLTYEIGLCNCILKGILVVLLRQYPWNKTTCKYYVSVVRLILETLCAFLGFCRAIFLSFHGNELGLKLIYVEKTNKSCAFFTGWTLCCLFCSMLLQASFYINLYMMWTHLEVASVVEMVSWQGESHSVIHTDSKLHRSTWTIEKSQSYMMILESS